MCVSTHLLTGIQMCVHVKLLTILPSVFLVSHLRVCVCACLRVRVQARSPLIDLSPPLTPPASINVFCPPSLYPPSLFLSLYYARALARFLSLSFCLFACLPQLLKMVGKAKSQAQVEVLFKGMDVNGDDTISETEFINSVLSMPDSEHPAASQ